MIKIKIIESPNSDQIGEYTFFKNIIYVGSNLDSDLYLEDPSLKSNHIFIEIADGQLIVQLSPEIPFILINGKRTTKFKFLTVTNKIKIGDSTLQIEAYALTQWKSKREVLNEKTDALIASNSPLIDIVKSVQEQQ